MDTKLIKQKILDLAIRGKLVPQNPADEPASVLLERIKAEKAQLIKEGKIKKEKPLSPIEEVPFEIPESWEWCKLGTISNYGQCLNVSTTNISPDSWILELEDIEKDSARVLSKLRLCDREIKGVRHQFEKGQILYSKLRTYLNKVLVAKENGFCTTEIIPFSVFLNDSFYICHVLRSPYFLDYTNILGFGVKMPRLSTTDAQNALIPLPPLEEQKRIVAEIERWFKWIDELEKNQQDLHTAIQQAKSKILDLAIHGKLVTQDPNDEPAYVLLDRIKAEKAQLIKEGKIKKEKPLPDIEEAPFEIPESWEWCRLGGIVSIISGTTIDKSLEHDSGIYPYVKVGDMNLKGNEYEIVTSNKFIDNPHNLVPINSIIFPKRGGAILTNKKRIIAKKPIWIDLNVMAIQIVFLETFRYIYNWFLTINLGEICNGGNIPQINYPDIANLEISIPPLAEQKRIVSKIEELFAQLDKIEDSLN